MVETVSYVIYIVSGVVYAQNGVTKVIDFSGTDAATVIKAAIGALPANGGHIYNKFSYCNSWPNRNKRYSYFRNYF
jgi:hypothetical protein